MWKIKTDIFAFRFIQNNDNNCTLLFDKEFETQIRYSLILARVFFSCY